MKISHLFFILLILFSSSKIYAKNLDLYTINQEDTLDKSLEIKYSYRKAKNTESDF